MKASDLWNKQTRIIEIAGDDAQVKGAACVAGQLIAAGVGNYLLVCASERQAREALNLVPLKGCVTHSSRPNIATANNADVLIFSGSQTAWLRRYRKLKHAGCIAFTPRLTPLGLLHFLCWLGHIFVGHYVFEGRLRCENAGEARTLLVSRIRKRKDTVTPRRYVPHGLGVRGLFEKLNGMSARYAILRWFENLPSMDEGEDIDMLVADEHIDEVRAVLDCGPGIVPVDCYSASGLPGTQYRKMAYYAPHLARDILEHTMLLKGIFRVPDSRHHFLSLAYHALYHKGLSSGLPPTSGGQPAQAPAEHDYTAALKRLAAESRIDVDISLDALDGYLKEQGWRPPLDTLCKLAPFNPWVNSLIAPELAKPTDTPGLACFIIRRSGFDRGQTDAIVARLEDEGFEILRVKKLNDEEAKLAAAQARGGNWVSNTKPPFWDPPAVAIAAYSLMPKAQSEKEMKLFPHRTDARLAIKERIRDDFTKDLPEDRRPNMLHSSDNSIEAEHYLRWLFPDELNKIVEQAKRLNDEFRTAEPVVRDLTRHGHRAKIELVRHGVDLAVKKTFRPSQRAFLEREAKALRDFGPKIKAMPELIAADGRSLTLRFYDDRLRYKRKSGRLLPRKVGLEAILALKELYDLGFAHLDAHPGNLIYDPVHGLKLLDYEYIHRYEHKPAKFEHSWDMTGCPAGYDGPKPRSKGASGYDTVWKPAIGLSLNSVLRDPAWLQVCKRALYCFAHAPRLLRQRWSVLRKSLKRR